MDFSLIHRQVFGLASMSANDPSAEPEPETQNECLKRIQKERQFGRRPLLMSIYVCPVPLYSVLMMFDSPSSSLLICFIHLQSVRFFWTNTRRHHSRFGLITVTFCGDQVSSNPVSEEFNDDQVLF